MDHGVEVIGPAFIPDPFVAVTYRGTLRKLSSMSTAASGTRKTAMALAAHPTLVTEDRGDPFQPA